MFEPENLLRLFEREHDITDADKKAVVVAMIKAYAAYRNEITSNALSLGGHSFSPCVDFGTPHLFRRLVIDPCNEVGVYPGIGTIICGVLCPEHYYHFRNLGVKFGEREIRIAIEAEKDMEPIKGKPETLRKWMRNFITVEKGLSLSDEMPDGLQAELIREAATYGYRDPTSVKTAWSKLGLISVRKTTKMKKPPKTP